MYCKHCGAQIPDNAQFCAHCGSSTGNIPQQNYQQNTSQQNHSTNTHNESKTAIGVVMGLFLGVIGLVIGILMYPEGTVARKTFLKAWLITYLVGIGVAFVGSFLMSFIMINALPYY